MISSASGLQRALAYQFSELALLEQALTHRSASKVNNERLEFLGDGVLNFIIADVLFERFPEASEGQLSRLRANLVRGVTLAVLARELRLGDYLQLGPGERKSGGHRRDSILAGALEAVIGAIYLDAGFDAARRWVKTLYREQLADLTLDQGMKDPKTRLQEYLQGRGMPLPVYRVVATEGSVHEQRFRVECLLPDSNEITEGKGTSRRKAEQDAARAALVLLGE